MLPQLTGCGYHLVGSKNSIPGVTAIVVVTANTPLGEQAKAVLLQQMSTHPRYQFVDASTQPHATLHIQHLGEEWSTQGFDNNGIANRYQMALHGSLWLQSTEESAKKDWRSGTIQQQEELFANGGPVATEANRDQLRGQLLSRWVERAITRLQSGF
ncbi:MAG: hypothetical protein R8J85_03200 [Mariprofundales bacterium]